MTRTRLVIATTNPHKVEEFRAIFADVPCDLVTPAEVGVTLRIDETGMSFEQNAVLKAIACAEATGLLSLADDSGLEIDALGGEPGIYSSRWAGEHVSYPERFTMLFSRLANVPDAKRTARYRCAIAIAGAAPLGLYDVVDGTLEGLIAREPRGQNGFGYDPIFYVPSAEQTVGQMSAVEKHQISHRARAAAKAREALAHLLEGATDEDTVPAP